MDKLLENISSQVKNHPRSKYLKLLCPMCNHIISDVDLIFLLGDMKLAEILSTISQPPTDLCIICEKPRLKFLELDCGDKICKDCYKARHNDKEDLKIRCEKCKTQEKPGKDL